MADFCQQCSIIMWGEDTGDLANLHPKETEPYQCYVLCEGCGPGGLQLTLVDQDGKCVHPDCKEHGGKKT